MTFSSGKHLEKVDNLPIISIRHQLLPSQQQTSELMYWFEESVTMKRQELTNNKTEEGSFFVNIMLIDFFWFVYQEKVTYGLSNTLTLKCNNNNNPILRNNGVDDAKIVMKHIGWYIPHFTPCLENQ